MTITRRHLVRMLALVVPVLALAAAAGAQAAGGSDLTGKLWSLTSLAKKPPVSGTFVSISFASGKVSGSAGCNHYAGTYTARGRSLKIGTPLGMTQMACEGAVGAQEQAFVTMLGSVRRYDVRHDVLTLKDGVGRELAAFQVQSQNLAGTAWKVVSYNNGKQAVVSVAAGSKLTAAFGKDGMLTGFAGCNSYDASYKASPPKLTLGPVASTKKACEQAVMDQESAYLTALGTARTYSIEGPQLELRDAKGAIAATFTRG